MGVDPQKNSSDCGVLYVAIAFDLLSAKGQCIAAYNSTIIRKHLSQCRVNCCLTPFPVIGKRSTSSIVYLDTVSVDLFCICRMPEPISIMLLLFLFHQPMETDSLKEGGGGGKMWAWDRTLYILNLRYVLLLLNYTFFWYWSIIIDTLFG